MHSDFFIYQWENEKKQLVEISIYRFKYKKELEKIYSEVL